MYYITDKKNITFKTDRELKRRMKVTDEKFKVVL